MCSFNALLFLTEIKIFLNVIINLVHILKLCMTSSSINQEIFKVA